MSFISNILTSLAPEKNVFCGYAAGAIVAFGLHLATQYLNINFTPDQSAALLISVTGGVAHLWDIVVKVLSKNAASKAAASAASITPNA